MHASTNGHPFLMEDRSPLDLTEAEREKIYQEAWEYGGLRFRAAFRDGDIAVAGNPQFRQSLGQPAQSLLEIAVRPAFNIGDPQFPAFCGIRPGLRRRGKAGQQKNHAEGAKRKYARPPRCLCHTAS